MVTYDCGFVYDPLKHKGFSKASRHVWSIGKGGPAPSITKEQEALLRLGLSAFDMDYRVGEYVSRSRICSEANDRRDCSGWAISPLPRPMLLRERSLSASTERGQAISSMRPAIDPQKKGSSPCTRLPGSQTEDL